MNSAFLAAGQSVRLKPITHKAPKPFLQFVGRPFLAHLIDQHLEARIEPKHIVVNPMFKDLFREHFPGLNLLTQEKPLGTADAVRIVLETVGKTLLIQYGDNLVLSSALRSLLEGHRGQVATVGLLRVPDPAKYGVVEINSNGNLVKVTEKPANPTSNLVLAGVFIFEPDFEQFLENVPLSPRGELELTDALNNASMKTDINAVVLNDNEWYDLTYPWDILKINKLLTQNLQPCNEGKVEGCVHIDGAVSLGNGSVIKSGSYIEGPVWIGNNVTIGPNAYLRPFTSIADNSKVGNACEVKNSVIYRGVHISHLSYVGDSVIAENTNLGAGTITANLRFDEEPIRVNIGGKIISTGLVKLGCFIGPDVKTGVNVTINPGVKIGAGARIYPGCVVTRDVSDNEFYRCERL
ncbi:MAG: sugar phosphate nucleotidyltransferase [Thermoprotei archaeon]